MRYDRVSATKIETCYSLLMIESNRDGIIILERRYIMKVTASIHFAPKRMKWSEVGAHNDRSYHDIRHDKNKNINYKYTKYNRYGTLLNYYQVMKPLVNTKKLKEQKTKYLHNRQKSRAKKYASPKTFLRYKKHRNCRCGVITLGNTKFRNKYEKALKDKFHIGKNPHHHINTVWARQYEARLLLKYIKGFNLRHTKIQIIRYAIHCDETFIHAHAEFISFPNRTKRGKMSFNFSRALREEMQKPTDSKLINNKTALKRFRHIEDRQLVNDFSINKSPLDLNLTRTGQATKDDQEQHSYAVSESVQASQLASQANSSISYLASLNSNYLDSLSSKEALRSDRAKYKSLSIKAIASSANNSATQASLTNSKMSQVNANRAHSLSQAKSTFDNSAYGSYYQILLKLPWYSNVSSQRIKDYAHFKVKDNEGRPISPIYTWALGKSSQASNAEQNYNNYHQEAKAASHNYIYWSNSAQTASTNYAYWNHNASSIASMSKSVRTQSYSVNAFQTSIITTYGNNDERSGFLIHTSPFYRGKGKYVPLLSDNHDIKSRFNHVMHRFINEHHWALRIAQKLHQYHLHLKHLFKIFLPRESDKDLNQFANGTRYFVRHPKESQEDIIFSLEDQHAKQLTSNAQRTNQQIYSENKSYLSSSDEFTPG